MFFSSENTPEEILRENFANIGRNPAAFSSISYVGTRTQGNPTDFSILLKEVQLHVKNSAVRSPRPASVIFNALVVRYLVCFCNIHITSQSDW